MLTKSVCVNWRNTFEKLNVHDDRLTLTPTDGGGGNPSASAGHLVGMTGDKNR